MKRHVNIPVFIPHLGCPNQCVFCNQRTISGVSNFDPSSVRNIIDTALTTVEDDAEAEIAFFGGSFTGIDRELMTELLEIAYKYIESGKVTSIRCSTRPDYISEEILNILSRYGVKNIELGLQSSSDKVLQASKRGHTYIDEVRACELITSHGFNLVGQMMIGLPDSTPEDEIRTADFIIKQGAVGARIYPTVVFYDTELYSMCGSGIYTPISLNDAVERSASVYNMFIENNVKVIRVGLCASENLSSADTYFGGPNHAALGEMVLNKVYLDRIIAKASQMKLCDNDILNITVARGEISKAIGQKKRNKQILKDTLGVKDTVFTESDNLRVFEISVEKAG